MHSFQFTVLCSLGHHCLLGSKKLGCKEMWFGSGGRPESNHGESPLKACKRGEAGGGRWPGGGECWGRRGPPLEWKEGLSARGWSSIHTAQRAKYPPHTALKPKQAKLGEGEQTSSGNSHAWHTFQTFMMWRDPRNLRIHSNNSGSISSFSDYFGNLGNLSSEILTSISTFNQIFLVPPLFLKSFLFYLFNLFFFISTGLNYESEVQDNLTY